MIQADFDCLAPQRQTDQQVAHGGAQQQRLGQRPPRLQGYRLMYERFSIMNRPAWRNSDTSPSLYGCRNRIVGNQA